MPNQRHIPPPVVTVKRRYTSRRGHPSSVVQVDGWCEWCGAPYRVVQGGTATIPTACEHHRAYPTGPAWGALAVRLAWACGATDLCSFRGREVEALATYDLHEGARYLASIVGLPLAAAVFMLPQEVLRGGPVRPLTHLKLQIRGLAVSSDALLEHQRWAKLDPDLREMLS